MVLHNVIKKPKRWAGPTLRSLCTQNLFGARKCYALNWLISPQKRQFYEWIRGEQHIEISYYLDVK